MSVTPYQAMQSAVDIVGTSPHPTNKIAATLFHADWSVSQTNFWPPAIAEKIGVGGRVGSSSGTVHAETACILGAPGATKGASLCITDPFCPNCAKNIAEAGIKTIYIDHKGFDKDFFTRRSDHFESMSMQVCEKAGISVYELWRKDERLVPIIQIDPGFIPPEDSPIEQDVVERADERTFKYFIEQATHNHARRKFAVALATDDYGATFALTVRSHAVRGYTMMKKEDMHEIEHPEGKYSFIQEPVNRLLMTLARRGLDLCDGYLYASQVPTSREQVNLAGAGITRICIGDTTRSRDAEGLRAMKLLEQTGVIHYT